MRFGSRVIVMCAISIDVGAKRGLGAAHHKPGFSIQVFAHQYVGYTLA